MRPELWNDGWSFRSKPNSFLELTGRSGPWLDVVVPHDAMVTEERSPAVGTPATAFHSGGTYEYRKALPADDDLRGKVVMLQFDGVYRDATVFVNGQFAAHRPYGYSQFSVDLVPYLRFGTDNDIHVTARAHDDSRWYSGAGIYRDVWLVVSDPVHLALDGVRVSTPDINDERVVVVVESTVVNDRRESASIEVETELVDASGSVVQRDVVPVPLAPGASVTVRQRMSVARDRNGGAWTGRICTRAVPPFARATTATATSSTTPPRRSASARCRSTPRAACASTASGSTFVARASTTTTA